MKYKAGFIGAGNMGGALLRSVAAASGGENVAVYDVSAERAERSASLTGASFTDAADIYKNSKYVFFAVKPNVIEKVIEDASSKIKKETVIVSMAAGVSLWKLKTAAGSDRVIRIMPNTPASIGEGVILYTAGAGVTPDDLAGFLDIMSKSGLVDEIDEKLIDAASALSGCGPAYVYMFIEALADGAVACGLPRDKALLYAKQTLLGAASLALTSGRHPGELKDAVCSPGGTTIEGVLALERSSFRAAAADAVISAFEKTGKLSK
ncbi:MAG: pyrroline-5-carboxylate reductase [Clostridia bacterium]|nr:pyrroline-5-carboxylate reductase [Clostridia bacterium]